jgi:hypothetical protein
MLTLRTRATGGNSWSGSWQKEVPASRGDAFPSHASNVRVVRASATGALTQSKSFPLYATRERSVSAEGEIPTDFFLCATGLSTALSHHRAYEAIPPRVRSLDLRGGPTVAIAQSERDRWRSAHSHVAMNHDSIDCRPIVDEPPDGGRVIARKEYVGRLSQLDDVVKRETEDRSESWRNARRLGVGIENRNADLSTARLVRLCVVAREYNDLGSPGGRCLPRARCAPHPISVWAVATLRSAGEQ